MLIKQQREYIYIFLFSLWVGRAWWADRERRSDARKRSHNTNVDVAKKTKQKTPKKVLWSSPAWRCARSRATGASAASSSAACREKHTQKRTLTTTKPANIWHLVDTAGWTVAHGFVEGFISVCTWPGLAGDPLAARSSLWSLVPVRGRKVVWCERRTLTFVLGRLWVFTTYFKPMLRFITALKTSETPYINAFLTWKLWATLK